MDVSPCNPLFDLWFVAMVLSRTLKGSSDGKKTNDEIMNDFEAGRWFPAFFLFNIFEKGIDINQYQFEGGWI